ncbi:MAG TPA: deoxyribose-phosphate aldolase [Bryobacteraceae bacterium]|nr:deoxyribose-phosphate aldolase [Bryobacteraceae bacterium]
MSFPELEKLVAEIGEKILADLRAPSAPAVDSGGIARLIDHTILKPDATRDQIVSLCREAREYGFASVCVNPCWVALAAAELAGAQSVVCSVCGFPLGASATSTKMQEAEAAIRCGAREIDMVINVGALRAGDHDAVRLDIRGVVETAHRAGAIVKVIIEAALLSDEQKVVACKLAQAAGADFVKTSTGFGPGGATAHDVALMRATVGPAMGVKAAGGIRTLEDLKTMVAAGADRIGASAGIQIIQAAR